MKKFDNYDDEHHHCGFCTHEAYWYCETCFPGGRPTHAFCNPATKRDCYAQHVAGIAPARHCRVGNLVSRKARNPRGLHRVSRHAQHRQQGHSAVVPSQGTRNMRARGWEAVQDSSGASWDDLWGGK